MPSCRRFDWHLIRAAASRTFWTAGTSNPIKMAIIAIYHQQFDQSEAAPPPWSMDIMAELLKKAAAEERGRQSATRVSRTSPEYRARNRRVKMSILPRGIDRAREIYTPATPHPMLTCHGRVTQARSASAGWSVPSRRWRSGLCRALGSLPPEGVTGEDHPRRLWHTARAIS